MPQNATVGLHKVIIVDKTGIYQSSCSPQLQQGSSLESIYKANNWGKCCKEDNETLCCNGGHKLPPPPILFFYSMSECLTRKVTPESF